MPSGLPYIEMRVTHAIFNILPLNPKNTSIPPLLSNIWAKSKAKKTGKKTSKKQPVIVEEIIEEKRKNVKQTRFQFTALSAHKKTKPTVDEDISDSPSEPSNITDENDSDEDHMENLISAKFKIRN